MATVVALIGVNDASQRRWIYLALLLTLHFALAGSERSVSPDDLFEIFAVNLRLVEVKSQLVVVLTKIEIDLLRRLGMCQVQ